VIIAYAIAAGVVEGATVPRIQDELGKKQAVIDGFNKTISDCVAKIVVAKNMLETDQKNLHNIKACVAALPASIQNADLLADIVGVQEAVSTIETTLVGVVLQCEVFLKARNVTFS